MFSLALRMSAAHNTLTVDGQTFDRSAMSREDNARLRRLVVEAFRKDHPEPQSRPIRSNRSRNNRSAN